MKIFKTLRLLQKENDKFYRYKSKFISDMKCKSSNIFKRKEIGKNS